MYEEVRFEDFVQQLSATESTEALQARLDACGIDEDLDSLTEDDAPGMFTELLRDFLSTPIALLTVEQIEALTCEIHELEGRQATKEEYAFHQFNYRVEETEHGLKATFTLPRLKSLKMVLNAAIESFEDHASAYQRNWMCDLVADINCLIDPVLVKIAEEETTYTFTILRDGAERTRAEQIDKDGKIVFIESETMYEVPTAIVVVGAVLQMDQTTYEGSLVDSIGGQGYLFEGMKVRTATGELVVNENGLCLVGCGRGTLKVDDPDSIRGASLCCAGSPERY